MDISEEELPKFKMLIANLDIARKSTGKTFKLSELSLKADEDWRSEVGEFEKLFPHLRVAKLPIQLEDIGILSNHSELEWFHSFLGSPLIEELSMADWSGANHQKMIRHWMETLEKMKGCKKLGYNISFEFVRLQDSIGSMIWTYQLGGESLAGLMRTFVADGVPPVRSEIIIGALDSPMMFLQNSTTLERLLEVCVLLEMIQGGHPFLPSMERLLIRWNPIPLIEGLINGLLEVPMAFIEQILHAASQRPQFGYDIKSLGTARTVEAALWKDEPLIDLLLRYGVTFEAPFSMLPRIWEWMREANEEGLNFLANVIGHQTFASLVSTDSSGCFPQDNNKQQHLQRQQQNQRQANAISELTRGCDFQRLEWILVQIPATLRMDHNPWISVEDLNSQSGRILLDMTEFALSSSRPDVWDDFITHHVDLTGISEWADVGRVWKACQDLSEKAMSMCDLYRAEEAFVGESDAEEDE
jgi:hypothetical protein